MEIFHLVIEKILKIHYNGLILYYQKLKNKKCKLDNKRSSNN